jgi:hypothetical protein
MLGHRAEFVFGRLDFPENPSAPLQEYLAFRRKPDASRTALEESHANALFQPGNAFADG